jgi:hypothetical protein
MQYILKFINSNYFFFQQRFKLKEEELKWEIPKNDYQPKFYTKCLKKNLKNSDPKDIL